MNLSGVYLFGLSGGIPQFCQTAPPANSSVSLAPPQPGRYDILFDGAANQTCAQISAFPTNPASLIVDSVDAISTTLSYANFTLTNASVTTNVNHQTQTAANVLDVSVQSSGASIPVTVNFNYSIADPGCPGCIEQIEVGVNTDSGPQACAYNGVPAAAGVSGPASNISVSIPNRPGRYYISVDRSQDYSCFQSGHGWWTGPPSASRYLAVVDVWSQ